MDSKYIGDMQVLIHIDTENQNSYSRFGLMKTKGDREISSDELEEIKTLTDKYRDDILKIINKDSTKENTEPKISENKLSLVHSTCVVAKGIKVIKCCICGKEGTTYANGVSICKECATKDKICIVCGKPL